VLKQITKSEGPHTTLSSISNGTTFDISLGTTINPKGDFKPHVVID